MKVVSGFLAALLMALGMGINPAGAMPHSSRSQAELFAVGVFQQRSPTVFVPVEVLAAVRDEVATYVIANTDAAIALLHTLKSAAGYWSAAYPTVCPAHQKLLGESGSSMGELALVSCGHPKVTLVEWHGATSVGVIPRASGPVGTVAREYVGNVGFFFDDESTGRVIGGFIAYVPSGQVNLVSLGPTHSVQLPTDALSAQHIQNVDRVNL